jgi:hypothetical protein
MKKNNSLKKFNKVAKRVYKISKKRDLGWRWQDAQKFTSANLFKQYKGVPISKIKVTEVDKNVIEILDATPMPIGVPTPTPAPAPTVCFDPFNIPTKDLKDINWWMLADQVAFFDNDLVMKISIGTTIDTGIVKKSEIMNLNETVEDLRRAGYGSDELIIFRILVAPNKSDDGKPCSYYVLATLEGSILDTDTSQDEVVKIVTESDLPLDIKKERELKVQIRQEKIDDRIAKKKSKERLRPSKVEGQDEAEKKQIEETLKNLESLYAKKLISKELFQANVKELKTKLRLGGQI